jgi:hypothetical protein
MRRENITHPARFWMPRVHSVTIYANERLEWRSGIYWPYHSDRPAGVMVWREDEPWGSSCRRRETRVAYATRGCHSRKG